MRVFHCHRCTPQVHAPERCGSHRCPWRLIAVSQFKVPDHESKQTYDTVRFSCGVCGGVADLQFNGSNVRHIKLTGSVGEFKPVTAFRPGRDNTLVHVTPLTTLAKAGHPVVMRDPNGQAQPLQQPVGYTLGPHPNPVVADPRELRRRIMGES